MVAEKVLGYFTSHQLCFIRSRNKYVYSRFSHFFWKRYSSRAIFEIPSNYFKVVRTLQKNYSKCTKQVGSSKDHLSSLEVETEPPNYRMSSIICTIGPSSREVKILQEMIATGMNIARLNFSHGSYDFHGGSIKNVKEAEHNYNERTGFAIPVGIALDTKGPEIRTGLLTGGPTAEIELVKGKNINLTTDKQYESSSSATDIYVDYENILKVTKPGNKVYIDDGLISLVVKEIGSKSLVCEIQNGGKLGSKKGVNLPGVPVDLPSVSEKDKRDLQFGVEQEVDMIFASFIRNSGAIRDIREVLGEKGVNIKIIAKIENQQGLDNIDDIIEAADGIMIARGDLGIEIPVEKVFLAQKSITSKCNKTGKPVICATQMLESMIKNPRPTRAEVSDVANAILDGADCVMLSGETAKGDYPLECVQTMSNICKEAEASIWHGHSFKKLAYLLTESPDITHAIAVAAVEASIKISASAIVVITSSGVSSQLISRYRPKCPILTVTRNSDVARKSLLHRGIFPLLYTEEPVNDWMMDTDLQVRYGLILGRKRGYIKTEDPIVIVTGWRPGSGYTNTVRIVKVPEKLDDIHFSNSTK